MLALVATLALGQELPFQAEPNANGVVVATAPDELTECIRPVFEADELPERIEIVITATSTSLEPEGVGGEAVYDCIVEAVDATEWRPTGDRELRYPFVLSDGSYEDTPPPDHGPQVEPAKPLKKQRAQRRRGSRPE